MFIQNVVLVIIPVRKNIIPCCVLCLLGVTVVMIVETAVMSRAAPISRANSISSPVRTAAASRRISSVTETTTAGMNLTSWITCAGLQRPPALPRTSGVTTETAYRSARCVTGATTAATTVMRKAVVSTASCDRFCFHDQDLGDLWCCT